jgi:2-polyprenyl-3-methyl-5-hydroxy-6-metoxy-1,4-benzoquinol methylase
MITSEEKISEIKSEYKPGLKRDVDKELVGNLDDAGKIKLTIDGYDKTASDWDKTRQNFWPELIGEIKKYIKINTRILDLGCGNGRLIKELEVFNIDYVGIDPSKELIKIAKEKYPEKNLQVFNGLDLKSFESESFNQVISIAVLHHIPPEKVLEWLKEVNRVTKQNTTSIFTTWNLGESNYDLNENKDAVIGFIHHKNTRYVHYYNYIEIKEIFEKSGYEVVDIKEIKRESGMSNTVIIVKK